MLKLTSILQFFYVFVAADVVAALCYYFLFPEYVHSTMIRFPNQANRHRFLHRTSRLTLEQMNQLFGDMEIEPKVKGTEVWIDSVENKSVA